MITIVRCYRTVVDANKRYLCWKPLCHKHLRLQTVANTPTETQCVLARVTNLRDEKARAKGLLTGVSPSRLRRYSNAPRNLSGLGHTVDPGRIWTRRGV